MTAPSAPPKGRSALVVLFAVVFLNLVGFGLILPLLPFFAQNLKAAAWQVTLMFAAYSLGQFAAEPIWGRLSDRIGRKPVLLGTVLANAVGYLALAFAPNIWVAIAIRLFTGFGAGNISTIQGYVADVTPPERRAARMGTIGAAFGLGFVVGPGASLITGLITGKEQLDHQGFQFTLFGASLVTLLAALGVFLFLKESRAKADPAAPRPAFLAGIGDARRNPVVSRVLLVTFLYMCGFAGMDATFGLWAGDRFGWGPRTLSACFVGIGVISAVFQGFLTGRLARRFGEAQVLAVGMLVFGTTLIGQTFNPYGWLTPILMAFGASGMAMAMPNISTMISRSVPPDRQGAMLGLNMASGSLARIGGPIVAGVLYSVVGHNAPFWVGGAMTFPAALMAINAGRAFRADQAERRAQAAAAQESLADSPSVL